MRKAYRIFVCVVLTTVAGCENVVSTAPHWRVYNPSYAVNDRGITRDVYSHLPPGYKGYAADPDPVAVAHEGTHMLNSALRNHVGGKMNAVYVGQGRYLVFREPRVTIQQVLAFADPQSRATVRDIMNTWETWNNEPMYIADELSAYMDGSQAAIELNVNWARLEGSLFNASRCIKMADALGNAIQRLDPTYPQLSEYRRYVAWQRQRLAKMLKSQ